MKNPIWIIVNGGDYFEGHQGHWADCHFSNATRANIEWSLENEGMWGEKVTYEIREMTDAEVEKYPEITEFIQWMMTEYGEV